MSSPSDEIIKRSKAIKGKVDLLEGLHKTCQLQMIGLSEPILNESRYLARSLADMLYNWNDANEELARNLATAELAVHSGINDAVDILITHVKSSLSDIEKSYTEFDIVMSSFGDDYIATLKAICEVDEEVVYSRQNRHERVEIYKRLADDDKRSSLNIISNFALKLPQIEAIARKEGKALGDTDGLMPYLLEALKDESKTTFFSIYLQPKYERLPDGDKCVGAEALLRLTAEGNLIPPKTIIDYSERNELISLIDMMVFEKVLNILEKHPDIPSISVNVSPLDLLLPDYSSQVLDKLSKVTDLVRSRLEFEITESMAINDESSFRHIKTISENGVKISIDDFGTGLTRFDYLARLPVNVIKIDKSLVDNYISAPESYGVLLSAISAIGKSCSFEVLAEGLETLKDVESLHKLGISKYQGYHFGKPKPLDKFLIDHKKNF